MHWWIIAAVAICSALLIQYLCASKLLRLKELLSLKTTALHDVRGEGQRLDEQANELKNQQARLIENIGRLRIDIKRFSARLRESNLLVPEADFPLEEPDAKAAPATASA